MKILHLFDFFSPHGGGTVDLIYKLTSALAKQGHQLEIYTSDYKYDGEFIASLEGVQVTSVHCLGNFANFYPAPGLIKLVRDNIANFDIVHLHCFRSFQNIVICHYAKKFGVPYVLDTHGSLPRKVPGEAGVKQLLRWKFDILFGNRILRDACKAVAETQVGVKEYRDFGVESERIALIPPPFDTDAFASLPPPGNFRRRYSLEDKKVVMFLGRINWIKGLDILVESFALLAKKRSDVKLVIVGNDDGYREALVKLIKQTGLGERVLFTGFLGGQEKLEALVDADVVVQTSRYEQGAWAPFEAVLCGTPIIVSDNSGAGEDVKRINAGRIVPFDDREALADAIADILERPGPARANTQRAAAYIRENMSMSRRIGDYERLYVECKQGISQDGGADVER